MNNNFAVNRKAKFDYEILDTFEAGIVLKGHEVKSVKNGQINLAGSYITLTRGGEAYLYSAHISPFVKSSHLQDYDPNHPRKLLLHKREINKMIGTLSNRGLTAVPMSVYEKKGLIKVEIAIVRGKKLHDKRQSIKTREIKRDLDRELRRR